VLHGTTDVADRQHRRASFRPPRPGCGLSQITDRPYDSRACPVRSVDNLADAPRADEDRLSNPGAVVADPELGHDPVASDLDLEVMNAHAHLECPRDEVEYCVGAGAVAPRDRGIEQVGEHGSGFTLQDGANRDSRIVEPAGRGRLFDGHDRNSGRHRTKRYRHHARRPP